MPLFDYKCKKCNETKELLIPLAKVEEAQNCEKCSEEMVKLAPQSISICQQGYSYNTAERDIKRSMS